MHDTNQELTLQPPAAPRAVPNRLTILQTCELAKWMDTPEIRDLVAKEADTKVAELATEKLGFHVTAGNIGGTRRALNIEKAKPTPAPQPDDINLAELQQKVQTLGADHDALKIRCTGVEQAVETLRAELAFLKQRSFISTDPQQLNPAH